MKIKKIYREIIFYKILTSTLIVAIIASAYSNIIFTNYNPIKIYFYDGKPQSHDYSLDGNFENKLQENVKILSRDDRYENLNLAYVSHNPIYINSNTDFTSQGFSGSGTEIDPYVLDGVLIIGNGSIPCIDISSTTSYFIISDNYILNGSYGIKLNNVFNGYISNNIVTNSTLDGVYVYNSNDNVITDNRIINNFGESMQINLSENNTISYNEIANCTTGLFLTSNSVNNTIIYNTISNLSLYGIYVTSSQFNNISSNEITSTYYGIFLAYLGSNNTLFANIISQGRNGGLVIGKSPDNIIQNNSFFNCGITFVGDYSQISFMTQKSVTGNLVNGLPIVFLQHTDNYIILGEVGQIILINCSYVEISNKHIHNSTNGIILYHSNNNTITMNAISDNSYAGLRLIYSSDNTLMSNDFKNNEIGVLVYYSPNNKINMNAFSNCGLVFSSSSGVSETVQDEVNDNTIDSLPLVFLQNQNGIIVSSNVGQVLLVNSSNVQIVDQTFSDVYNPVQILYSSNTSVRNSIFLNSRNVAIIVQNSSNIVVQSNMIKGNIGSGMYVNIGSNITIDQNRFEMISSHGIQANYVYDSKITNNTLTSITQNALAINYGGHNTVKYNSITNNSYGIYLYISHFNIFEWNVIVDNSLDGIYLNSGSSNNTIQRNAFVNNTRYGVYIAAGHNNTVLENYFAKNNKLHDEGTSQVNIYETNENNTVSHNYFADITSPDSNKDGIVDNPYPLDGSTIFFDNFTLTYYSFDVDAPSISSPENIEITNEIQTYSIVWKVSDIFPYTYNITLNDKLIVDSTYWTNGSITIELSNLEISDYNLTINLYDALGQHSKDSILLRKMTDSSAPNSSETDPIVYLLIGSVSGVIVLIDIVQMRRRSRTKKSSRINHII